MEQIERTPVNRMTLEMLEPIGFRLSPKYWIYFVVHEYPQIVLENDCLLYKHEIRFNLEIKMARIKNAPF